MVERIPELMRRAFYQLRTGKGGPVLLEVPRDIWTDELRGKLDYKPVFGNKTVPPPDGIREVAEVLLEAKRPVIYAGQGCLYAEAWDELQEIAELLQAPVTTTMPGKSAFPEDHPLALGASAVSHTKGTWHFLKRADLVFAIGTSLTRTTYGKTIPPGKTIIHSTADASDVNKDYQSDYSLLGDAKLTLQGLIDEIKARTDGVGHRNKRDVASEVAKIRKEWLDDWMPQMTSDEVPINQYRIIHDLQANVDAANTIITHDAGSPRDQLVPMWQCTAPRTYIGWGKSTQLGFGLGAIMGAKLAEPDKLCINIMGDAAIGMVGMDIETAVRTTSASSPSSSTTRSWPSSAVTSPTRRVARQPRPRRRLPHGCRGSRRLEREGREAGRLRTGPEARHCGYGARQARRPGLRGQGGLRLLQVRVVSPACRAPSRRPR